MFGDLITLSPRKKILLFTIEKICKKNIMISKTINLYRERIKEIVKYVVEL